MTPLDEIMVRVPITTLLLYVPVICWLDLRDREIPHELWIPLWVVNIPALYYLYRAGYYPLAALPISLVMCGIFYVMNARGSIEGADMLWLWAISLFFVINPWPVPHGIMQPVFYIYLIVIMILTAGVLLVLNYRKGYRDTMVQMMSRWDNGVPFVVPISAALVATVVFG
jgi:hypothetical protein